MKKFLLLVWCVVAPLLSIAQFATGGSGRYTDRIFWLNWDWATTADSFSGIYSYKRSVTYTDVKFNSNNRTNLTQIPEGIYTWMINPFVKVEATVSNKNVDNYDVSRWVSNTPTSTYTTTNCRGALQNRRCDTTYYSTHSDGIGGRWMSTSVTSYFQSGFQYMYKGLENKKIAIGNVEKGTTTAGRMDIVIKMFVLKATGWEMLNDANNGVVFSDAESLSNSIETITCLVNNNSEWYLLDAADTRFNSSRNTMEEIPTANSCNAAANNNRYKISNEDVTLNSIRYKKITLNNESSNAQIGNTALLYLKGVDTLKQLTVRGQGVTHVAVGYYISNSISKSYRHKPAMHLLDLVNTGTASSFVTIPANTRDICLASIRRDLQALDNNTEANVATDVYFGAPPTARGGFNLQTPNDPFVIYHTDGIEMLTKPVMKTTMPLTFNINATNKKSNQTARVLVWADANFNGVFDTYELISENIIPANTVNATIQVTTAPINFVVADTLAIRFRITTEDNIPNVMPRSTFSTTIPDEDPRSFGFATNGEVEDFLYDLITPLPLTLTSFEGKNRGYQNEITWTTMKEDGVQMYEVEKYDFENATWYAIGNVEPKNSFDKNTYKLIDNDVLARNQYRLKIYDLNKIEYSKVVMLYGPQKSSITTYPNPANDYIYIKGLTETTNVSISNASGQVMLKDVLEMNNAKIDVSRFSPGVYILSIGSEKVKFVKN